MFYHVFAALPEWAPLREDPILYSYGVLTSVQYAHGELPYTATQAKDAEYLRLSFPPPTVTLEDAALPRRADGDLEWELPRRGHHHSARFWRRVLLPLIENHLPEAACVPLATVWHAAFRSWKTAATLRESAWALDAGGLNGKMDGRNSLEWFQAQRIREMPGYPRGSYRAGLAEDESLLIRAEPSSMDGVLRSVPHPTSFTSTALALVHKDPPLCPQTASPRVAGSCRALLPSARPAS